MSAASVSGLALEAEALSFGLGDVSGRDLRIVALEYALNVLAERKLLDAGLTHAAIIGLLSDVIRISKNTKVVLP